jgi:hypothetical protein
MILLLLLLRISTDSLFCFNLASLFWSTNATMLEQNFSDGLLRPRPIISMSLEVLQSINETVQE